MKGMKMHYIIPIYYTNKRYHLGTYRENRSKIEEFIDANIQLVLMSFLFLSGLIYSFVAGGLQNSLRLLVSIMLTYIGIQSVYEIGYLVNDNIASKKEGKKGRNVFNEYLSLKEIIILSLIRIVFFGIIISIMLLMGYTTSFVMSLTLISFLLLGIFLTYNLLPPKWRALLLFFPLRFVKYFAFFFPLTTIGISSASLMPYVTALSINGTIIYALRKLPNDEIRLRLHLWEIFLQLFTITLILIMVLKISCQYFNLAINIMLLILLFIAIIATKMFSRG